MKNPFESKVSFKLPDFYVEHGVKLFRVDLCFTRKSETRSFLLVAGACVPSILSAYALAGGANFCICFGKYGSRKFYAK